MTSFCLQITRKMHGNVTVSDLRNATVEGNIPAELNE